jgi:hypothetical protein
MAVRVPVQYIDAERKKGCSLVSDHRMKGIEEIRSHMKWNVKMSGRSGRGEHKVNIECRKAEKDVALYSR